MLTRTQSNSNNESIDLKYKIDNNKLIIDLNFNLYRYDLNGETYELELINECINNGSKVITGTFLDKLNQKFKSKKINKIYETKFTIDSSSKRITIDFDNLIPTYTYNGDDINLNLVLVLKKKSGFLAIKKLEKNIDNILSGKKSDFSYDANIISEPYDTFNIFKNFKTVGIYYYLLILILIIIYVLLVKYDDELLKFIVAFIFIIGVIFYKSLNKYIRIKFNSLYFDENISKEYNCSEIIHGKSKVDLKNFTFRIVASNIEKTIIGSGKHKKHVKNPVNSLILYEQKIDFLPKNTDISDYLKGTFTFKDMYNKLYPPIKITDYHGLDIEWKVQILTNDLVDVEFKGPINFMKYENFINKKAITN